MRRHSPYHFGQPWPATRVPAPERMLVVGVLVCLIIASLSLGAEPEDRPDNWAQPVELEGVPNLHKVNEHLYRSAQPTAEGMRNLKSLGIKTIVNLRSFHSDSDELGDTGLQYEHITMKPWHPEHKEAVRFLKIVTDPKRSPVLVHCQQGADRTGTMCALYRIAVEDWTKEDALREMQSGGFGFHSVWQNLLTWIRELDIEAVRKEAEIAAPAEPAAQPDP